MVSTELAEPVVEIAADSTGAGMVFARTPSTLYRADTQGMSWSAVENLGSTPTALTVVNGIPATVYVGTADRGLLTSQDGLTWSMANDGLNFVPGSRLMVDAIAADPAQSDVLYVATSYLYGTTTVHQSPVGVSMTTNGGATWSTLAGITRGPGCRTAAGRRPAWRRLRPDAAPAASRRPWATPRSSSRARQSPPPARP